MGLPRTDEAARQLQKTSVRELGNRGVRQLGWTIRRYRAEIERRWLEQVQADVARRPGIGLTQLRDGMPDYLDALVDLLHHSRGESLDVRAQEAWARIAHEHGITRVRIGFDVAQLVHEFVVLRHVIRDIAEERGTKTEGAEALLADVLDAAINVAVQAYVDARDYDARRRQAENIAFLTHELRNPLSTAAMGVGRLRQNATPDMERTLGRIERAHRRLNELIESVLLTEKLEAGQIESKPRLVTLEEVLEPALEAARATAREKGVTFKAVYDAARQVHLDPVLTRSAVQNLVDNAVKYTDSGTVDVTVVRGAQHLGIHVRDNCSGLSPEELRTIFEPFQRGSTHKPGTGLGLAIARRAVEAQGGTIGAESPGPQGCHFWISLPAKPARPARPARPRASGR
jgi:signal transduction histidine kinase